MTYVTKGAVVVTGASTGIGAACALRLDQLGFQVFAGVRKNEDAQALQQKASPKLTPIFLDVTDTDSITASVEKVAIAVENSALIGLVNNAGIAVAAPLEFIPITEFRRQLEVNTTAQLAVTQAFLPLLRSAKGRIVNMGSISGRSTTPFLGAYSASKFALEALTDALRLELRPWGIWVAIIEPGAIATPIWQKSLAQADILQQNLPYSAHELYGRAMNTASKGAANLAQKGISPDQVAQAVVHALTAKRPKTRYLVGQDARIRAMLKFLPDRIVDEITAKAMNLQ
ncbi:SDR family oxidoreductase [Gloeocapsopsis crepidinum LEGE 06123]|uniref:SDR family oxidoreductase n=1 Tax=Gloeocapsopsis crepidinum LEGE 06123 TaxID=588587 RepID=A0ABR9UVH7_9CHRO|nr:SDR family oxidoreductase [Gloeocapsopsis crepidinum]MBE9191318.1 SDR family oxidoreductase [Gloeocapsopsis crepidinum LEGE 06123]